MASKDPRHLKKLNSLVKKLPNKIKIDEIKELMKQVKIENAINISNTMSDTSAKIFSQNILSKKESSKTVLQRSEIFLKKNF